MADNCHNTTGMLGQSPSQQADRKARPIADIMHDAIMLHAFAQGVYELHDTLKTDRSPASNAMPAMFDSLIERAHRLAEDIEAFDFVERRT